MKTILVLGATGRTGRSVLKHRPDGATVYAAVRRAGPGAPLPEGADAPRVVDIEDQASLSAALEGVDAVINAIRLRGDIAATALVCLHQSIVAARDTSRDLHVVHVGGAGSLRVGGGRRFCQAPGFPVAAEGTEGAGAWRWVIGPSLPCGTNATRDESQRALGARPLRVSLCPRVALADPAPVRWRGGRVCTACR